MWAHTRQLHGAASLPRPELPPWRQAEVFADRVLLPPTTPSAVGTAGLGIFAAFLALLSWWRGHSVLLIVGLAVVAAILVVTGCFLMWWVPARWERRLRRTHARALECGVGTHAYRTRFFRPEENQPGTPVSLLVDETLSSLAATRLQHAVRNWLSNLTTNAAWAMEAVRLLDRRWVVPTVEIFGPEATGGWLVVEQGDDNTPWRLLIDRPDGPVDYFFDEVMVIAGRSGRLYLDE